MSSVASIGFQSPLESGASAVAIVREPSLRFKALATSSSLRQPKSPKAMARFAQNTTCGNTCPWGSGDASLPDAFTIAAEKAARRRESKEAVLAAPEEAKDAAPEEKATACSEVTATARSVASRGTRASRTSRVDTGRTEAMEAKMMDLIEKCVDKKVLQMQLQPPAGPSGPTGSGRSVRTATARSARSARSVRSTESVLSQPGVPSHVETDTSVKAEPQPEAVTMAGKRAQAAKLSDAALGQFDDEQRRLAYLEMQKSAAEARNKNRSALTFGYEPPSRVEEAKGETMAGKRAQAQKLSDASLGKFDADESRLAYLEMQKSAAEVRNKNRSAMSFNEPQAQPYPALLREVDGLAHPTMAGKRAQKEKVSEAKLGKFDADKSLDAYLDMQKSAEEMRNKHRVGQGIF